MNKLIRARLYINRKFKDEEQGRRMCDRIDKEIKDWPIDYRCFENEDGQIIFDINIESDTYKACEMFYQYMKQAIKDQSYAVPKVVAKIKYERID